MLKKIKGSKQWNKAKPLLARIFFKQNGIFGLFSRHLIGAFVVLSGLALSEVGE